MSKYLVLVPNGVVTQYTQAQLVEVLGVQNRAVVRASGRISDIQDIADKLNLQEEESQHG